MSRTPAEQTPDRSQLAALSDDQALALGRSVNPGIPLGRPGHGWLWPVMLTVGQVLRVRYAIEQSGRDRVAPGPAIVVSNHRSALDPGLTVIATGWRASAFTKAEVYDSPFGRFFAAMGQIPLRRGDEASTDWALDQARRILAAGGVVGVYPEGTRGPDDDALYRLHHRVLVPLLRESPEVPVHALAIRYRPAQIGRASCRERV